jgi:hypothetical protein
VKTRCVTLLGVTLVGLALMSPATDAIQSPNATAAARQERLAESGTLRMTKAAGFLVEASGQVTGTLHGILSLRLTLVSTSHLTATFTGHPHNGTLSGQGAGTYHLVGAVASFSGVATITGGSGAYAHATGGGVQVKGTMNRQKKIVTLQVAGNFRP